MPHKLHSESLANGNAMIGPAHVHFDEHGVSDDVDDATRDLALQVPGFGLHSSSDDKPDKPLTKAEKAAKDKAEKEEEERLKAEDEAAKGRKSEPDGDDDEPLGA